MFLRFKYLLEDLHCKNPTTVSTVYRVGALLLFCFPDAQSAYQFVHDPQPSDLDIVKARICIPVEQDSGDEFCVGIGWLDTEIHIRWRAFFHVPHTLALLN